MARRVSKKESEAWAILIVAGILVAGVAWFFQTVGFVIPLAIVAGGGGLYAWYTVHTREQRRMYLMSKYGDEDIVRSIMQKTVWQDQTADQYPHQQIAVLMTDFRGGQDAARSDHD